MIHDYYYHFIAVCTFCLHRSVFQMLKYFNTRILVEEVKNFVNTKKKNLQAKKTIWKIILVWTSGPVLEKFKYFSLKFALIYSPKSIVLNIFLMDKIRAFCTYLGGFLLSFVITCIISLKGFIWKIRYEYISNLKCFVYFSPVKTVFSVKICINILDHFFLL